MSLEAAPVVDRRDAASLVRELLSRAPAHLPGWTPAPGGPGWALLHIVARYGEAMIERLNRAPDKNKLAFLDLLGIELLPARPARAPVVLRSLPHIGDGRVPARTRVGAKVAGSDEPLVFETDTAIALASARLAEVVSVWPDRDASAHHGADVAAGRPFSLFEPLQPTERALYLAHETLLDFNGRTTIEVELRLAGVGGDALECLWECWDGALWRPFAAHDPADETTGHDGTLGLTRSGTVRLGTACGRPLPVKVNGVEARWIRVRPKGPLPPSPGLRLPELDRVRMRVITERPLAKVLTSEGPSWRGGLEPNRGFGDGARLDLTTTFFPLGRAPGPASLFHLACEEPFSKPGAEVRVGLRRVTTAEEEADAMEAALLEKEAKASIVQAAIRAGEVAHAAGQSVAESAERLIVPSGDLDLTEALPTLASATQAVAAVDDLPPLPPAIDDVADAITHDAPLLVEAGDAFDIADILNIQSLRGEVLATMAADRDLATGARDILDLLAGLGARVVGGAVDVLLQAAHAAGEVALDASSGELWPSSDFAPAREALETSLGQLTQVSEIGDLALAADTLAQAMDAATDALADVTDDLLWPLFDDDFFDDQLAGLLAGTASAVHELASVVTRLQEIAGLPAAGTVDEAAPALKTAELAWEYWAGSSWRTLFTPDDGDEAAHFRKTGEVGFTVPDDFKPSEINGVTARWIRARIAKGAFARVRMVRWSDAVSGTSNVMPIVEPRPPALAGMRVGYKYRSPSLPPEHCFAHNDFVFEDRTHEARWPGPSFPPFRTMPDLSPTLYLGFDRALPADLVSLYLDVVEKEDETEGPDLVWEHWSGSGWQALTVQDDTRALAIPGMAAVVWPGLAGPAAAEVVSASGASVVLRDPREAARFRAGDLVFVQKDEEGELATVVGASSGVVTLATPLGRDYALATLAHATAPRFGKPRTWIRARLKENAPPPRVRLRGVHVNGVWASQMETVENEVVGSADGQPSQVVFLRRTPVLEEEWIEVRELSGPRATTELALLREGVLAQGLADDELRTVSDRRTGAISEVWVRWQTRPHLFFSGPDDRHIVLERARGRLVFGDNVFGKVPPPGPDNIRVRRYRTGGGLAGNVAKGAITQLLSGLPVEAITNPRAAEGGADGEPEGEVLTRGPAVLRHHRQATSAADYEALAREASPAVALARALSITDAAGLPTRGHVRLVIVPQSDEAQPQPSSGLRRQVRAFVLRRAPATLAGLEVAGPDYLAIGVEAVIVPVRLEEGGVVLDRARARLRAFFHPRHGGPHGQGWPFGRSVHLSDLAAALERVPGVDYVRTLNLLVDGTPRGKVVVVPDDRIVAPGPFELAFAGREA